MPTNRWKETVQSVLALTVLVALFWLCRPGLFGSDANEGGNGLFGFLGVGDGVSHLDDYDAGCSFEDCEESEDLERHWEYEDILVMPTCDDLGHSIEKIRDVRNRLLDAAVEQDTNAMLVATAEYSESVREMRACLTTLKMRVAPGDFPNVCDELLDYYAVDDGESLLPCELGPFEKDIYQ